MANCPSISDSSTNQCTQRLFDIELLFSDMSHCRRLPLCLSPFDVDLQRLYSGRLELTGPIVLQRLMNLSIGIHHKRSVLGNRFV